MNRHAELAPLFSVRDQPAELMRGVRVVRSRGEANQDIRDAGPMTLGRARHQLDQLKGICDKMVRSTGGLVECVILADLSNIGGHTECIEVPRHENQLARVAWNHPDCLALRLKLLRNEDMQDDLESFGDENPAVDEDSLEDNGPPLDNHDSAALSPLTPGRRSPGSPAMTWPTRHGGLGGVGGRTKKGGHYSTHRSHQRRALTANAVPHPGKLVATQTIKPKFPISPQIQEWRKGLNKESFGFESVTIWAEMKLSELPTHPDLGHVRLAGICEILYMLTDRIFGRFGPLMKLLHNELRSHLFLEFSEIEFEGHLKREQPTRDSEASMPGVMDSAHLVRLTPFSKLAKQLAFNLARVRLMVDSSQEDTVVNSYRAKAIEISSKHLLKAYCKVILVWWRQSVTETRLRRNLEEKLLTAGVHLQEAHAAIDEMNSKGTALSTTKKATDTNKQATAEASAPQTSAPESQSQQSNESAAAPAPAGGRGRQRKNALMDKSSLVYQSSPNIVSSAVEESGGGTKLGSEQTSSIKEVPTSNDENQESAGGQREELIRSLSWEEKKAIFGALAPEEKAKIISLVGCPRCGFPE